MKIYPNLRKSIKILKSPLPAPWGVVAGLSWVTTPGGGFTLMVEPPPPRGLPMAAPPMKKGGGLTMRGGRPSKSNTMEGWYTTLEGW